MTHSIGLTHVVTRQWFHFSRKFCLSLWPHPNVHAYILHAHMMCESSMIEHLSVQSFCLCFAIPISDLPAIALQNDYVWLDFIPTTSLTLRLNILILNQNYLVLLSKNQENSLELLCTHQSLTLSLL